MSKKPRPTVSVFLEPGRFGEDSCSSPSCVSSDMKSTFKEYTGSLVWRKDLLFDGKHIQESSCLLSRHAETGVGFLYSSALNTKAPCQIDTFWGTLAARIKKIAMRHFITNILVSVFSQPTTFHKIKNCVQNKFLVPYSMPGSKRTLEAYQLSSMHFFSHSFSLLSMPIIYNLASRKKKEGGRERYRHIFQHQ